MSEYLQGLLDQHWRLLKEVEEDNRIDKDRNARLLREARKWIDMAQQFLDAGMIGQRDKVARFGFSAMLDAAKKSLMMACGEDVLLAGADFKERMSKFGKMGAEIRWKGGARGAVHLLIDTLKNRNRYQDWNAREKWDQLISLMNDARVGEDREPLNPSENWIEGDADQSTISYSGDNGTPLTYKTFKNRLSS